MRYLVTLLTCMVLIAIVAFTNVRSLVITSKSFENNGPIPVKYSCEGDAISPPLAVANIPSNTKSLALIVHDPDAPVKDGVTHWLL